MSVIINRKTCSREQLEKLNKDLNLTIKQKQKNKNHKSKVIFLSPFRVHFDLLFIPFSYGIRELNFQPIQQHETIKECVFLGVLRPEQKEVRNETIDLLNRHHSVVVSTHVGFGKSILATYFMCKIKLKTLIIVNRLVLITQWIDVLNRFIKDPKVFVIKPSSVIDWNNDFFIVNAINIEKIGYMPEIGLVVVDELHLIVSKVLSINSFFSKIQINQYIQPIWTIGSS